MTLLGFIVLVVLLCFVALLAERELYRRRRKDAVDAALEGDGSLAARLGREATRLFENVRSTGEQLVVPSHARLSPAFRQWVENDLKGHDDIKQWLLSLPDEGFRALTQQIALFCLELNIDLEWLIKGDLAVEPEVQQVVEDIVIGYSDACRKAVRIQSELLSFREYQETLERLARNDNQEFGQRLLAKLREANLVDATAPDLVWASDSERRDYALNSIREAAKQDRQKFNRIWDEVLAAQS